MIFEYIFEEIRWLVKRDGTENAKNSRGYAAYRTKSATYR